MAERLEDLNLPNSVVTRLIKDALPDGVNIAKEARTAIGRAASVFVLFVTSSANNVAIKNNKKTISAQDVLQAIVDTEFENFSESLQEALEDFKVSQKIKKDAAAKKKLSKKSAAEETVAEEVENDLEDIKMI